MPIEGSKRKLLFLAVMGAIFIQAAPVWMLREQIKRGSSDFSSFYSAGRIVATGHGSQLYDLGLQREAQQIFTAQFGRPPLLPFYHPPFEALIFAPLSVLPYGAAFALWMSCNIAMSIGAMFLLRPYLQSLQGCFDLALIAVSFFVPLLVALSQGQDSIVVLFLFALCFVSLMRNREWLAGCALGLAMVKPQLALPAVLMLGLAHEKRLRLLAGFLSTGFALGLLSVGVVGWRTFISYPAVLVQFVPENPGIINPGDMPTLRGLFSAILGQRIPRPDLYLCIAASSAALIAVAVAAWRTGGRLQDSRQLNFALVVMATVLVAFHGNLHDSALLVLPILMVCDWLIRKRVNSINRVLLAASVAALFVLPMVWENRQLLCCATLALFFATWSELRGNRVSGQQHLSAAAPVRG